MRSSLRQIARQSSRQRGRSSISGFAFDANPSCFCRRGGGTSATIRRSRGLSTTTSTATSANSRKRSQSPVRGARTIPLIETSKSTSNSYFYNPNNNKGSNFKYRWLSTVVATDPTNSSTTKEDDSDSAVDSNNNSSGSISTDQLLLNAGIDRAYLEDLASQHPTPLRLKDMYHLGSSPDPDQRLRNAQFLHQELPVRIAQRAMDLISLPHGLSAAPPIQQVAAVYLNFLQKLRDFPRPTTAVEEFCFTDMLQALILDRTSIPVSIAQGVQTWWTTAQEENAEQLTEHEKQERLHEMEEALYRFFTARAGLRFLTEHYVLSSNRPSATALRNVTSMFPSSESENGRGLIQSNVCVVQEIRRVADLVTHQTREFYGAGMCPIIDIVDCVGADESKTTFTYVPQHLHYMMTELLKNSCRASVRRYRELLQQAEANGQVPAQDHGIEIPRIRVVIVKGEEDVTIKIADKGGGIPRSLLPTIWKFAHSTASPNEQEAAFGTDVSGARIRGFGLPLARIYARYFGGELTLKSTEGHGLDAYLHLPRLGDACEKLPLRVRDSPGERDSMPLQPSAAATTPGTAPGSSSKNSNKSNAWSQQQQQQQQQPTQTKKKKKRTKPVGSTVRTYSTSPTATVLDTLTATTTAPPPPPSHAGALNALAGRIGSNNNSSAGPTALGL